MSALERRLLAQAEDVGRMRRRLRDESRESGYLAVLASRLADHVDALDSMLRPTAADLVRAGLPVGEALDHVDQHVAALRRLLGEVKR